MVVHAVNAPVGSKATGGGGAPLCTAPNGDTSNRWCIMSLLKYPQSLARVCRLCRICSRYTSSRTKPVPCGDMAKPAVAQPTRCNTVEIHIILPSGKHEESTAESQKSVIKSREPLTRAKLFVNPGAMQPPQNR